LHAAEKRTSAATHAATAARVGRVVLVLLVWGNIIGKDRDE
jgi:hypothetical protein